MTKMRDIRNMTVAEIKQRHKDAVDELSNLQFQLATHQLDNTASVKLVRRDVARLNTVLKEIECGKRKQPGLTAIEEVK